MDQYSNGLWTGFAICNIVWILMSLLFDINL
jgi:hypothetical protein